jgi:hypothetical protein
MSELHPTSGDDIDDDDVFAIDGRDLRTLFELHARLLDTRRPLDPADMAAQLGAVLENAKHLS